MSKHECKCIRVEDAPKAAEEVGLAMERAGVPNGVVIFMTVVGDGRHAAAVLSKLDPRDVRCVLEEALQNLRLQAAAAAASGPGMVQ